MTTYTSHSLHQTIANLLSHVSFVLCAFAQTTALPPGHSISAAPATQFYGRVKQGTVVMASLLYVRAL
jgi:hypothetical protein